MIQRSLFTPEHEAFRDSFRRFIENEIAPFHADWEEQGYVERAVWNKAGENGFLCLTMPEAYGGAGADKLYSVVQMEEVARAGCSGIGYSLHSEIVAPYILHYGSEAQKLKYLPRLASGEMIGAIAMSEPAAGSDLQGIKATALRQADGSYLLNGSKTFITNGWHADLVIVVAKTNPAAGAKGTSLLLVERGMAGFSVGKRLKKLGMKAQDTSELFFDSVKVPADMLLGGPQQEGRGFICLMEQLPWERLQIAISAVAAAQAAIDWTVDYVKQRKVFGQPVAAFQNTRFTLAELQTEVQVARAQAGLTAIDDGLPFGSVGENLSLRGVLEGDVWVGDVLRFAHCELRVTQPREPCYKFNAAMGFNSASKMMAQQGCCGFYLAVQRSGRLSAGESFEHLR